MIGSKMTVMKMKFDKESPREKIRLISKVASKNDIIQMKTDLSLCGRRFLLKSILTKKSALKVVPIEDMFSTSDFIEKPILLYPADMITEIRILPREDILFLINQSKNPHIYEALVKLK